MGQARKRKKTAGQDHDREAVAAAYESLPKERNEVRISCKTEKDSFEVVFGIAGGTHAYIHQVGPDDHLGITIGTEGEAASLFQRALNYLVVSHFFVSSDPHSRARFGTQPDPSEIPTAVWETLGVKIVYDEGGGLFGPTSHPREEP